MKINFKPFHSSAGEWRIDDTEGRTILMPYHESTYPVEKVCMLAGNAPRMLRVLKLFRKYLRDKATESELCGDEYVLAKMLARLIDDCTKDRGQYDDR